MSYGRILSGKAPGNGRLLLIAVDGPGVDLPLSNLEGGQTLGQTLTIQDREFDLGHIQPTAVFRGVIDLKAALYGYW